MGWGVGACGVCVGAWEDGCCGVRGVCRGVWGCGGIVWGLWGEKVSLAPLYYPETLVNPDTCLGTSKKLLYHVSEF